MVIKVSPHSFVTASATASISSKPEKEEHKDSPVKKKENRIDDPIVAGRVKRLAEHNRQFPFKCNLAFMLPTKGNVRKKVKLSFNFNVGEFLKVCIANLRATGFKASSYAKFKGGALSFLIDGHPKKLHDLDLSLRIEPPENPKDWQQIHEIIMLSLEEVAGLTRPFQNDKDGIVVYKQQKVNKDTHDRETVFYEEMVMEHDVKGHLKKYLFEQPDTVKTTFCTNEYFRSQNEQYLLYGIPTTPCPIEIEIVASHQNSSTCSLDALRIDYDLEDTEETDFYYSAEDGWDPKYILQLREKGLFDVHKHRIPTIRQGFFRYCAMLLKGYLPTELNFEQLYGQHLASDLRLPNGKTALEDLEDGFEKYLNEHCKNFDKRVLFLLISLGTVSRLNIAQATKDRLFALYEKELAKALRTTVSKELIEYATLFFYLYFNDHKAHSKEIEKPLDCNYAKKSLKLLSPQQLASKQPPPSKKLTRVYSKDGKRGDAFVLETTSLPSLEAIQEKLRKARSSNPAFAELCLLFIPDEEALRNLLGEKIQKQEVKEADDPKEESQTPLLFADFAAFLTYVESSSLHPKKQAKCLIDLFSSKNKTLNNLDKEQREKLKKIIIKIVQTLQDKERSLETAVCTAAAEVEISFEMLEVLFEALESSATPWVLLEFLNKMSFKAEKLTEHLKLWEKALDKINSQPSHHSAIVSFYRHFALFCEKCRTANVLEKLNEACKKIIETSTRLLNESINKNALVWCHQVQKFAAFDLLKPVVNTCTDLIAKGMKLADQRFVSLYLGFQEEFLKGDVDRFVLFFQAFVEGAFPCKDMDSSCTAIKEGINRLVHQTVSIEKAKPVLEILENLVGDDDFPASLKISTEFLGKYCRGKKEELYSIDGLRRLKDNYVKTLEDADMDHFVDYFKKLLDKTKEEPALHSVYLMALELFEVALKDTGGTPRGNEILKALSSLIKYKHWTDEEKARWGTCLGKLAKILNPPKVTAPKKESAPSEKVEDQPEQKNDIMAKLEEKIKAGAPNTMQLVIKLVGAFKQEKDGSKIIRCAEAVLPFINDQMSKSLVLLSMGKVYSAIGQLENATMALEEAYDLDERSVSSAVMLATAYINNQEWLKAVRVLKKLKQAAPDSFYEKSNASRCLKIASYCAVDNLFNEAIPLLLHPEENQDYSRNCLIGRLFSQFQDWDAAFEYFQKAEKQCPNHPEAALRLGHIYKQKGNIEKAIEYYEKAKKLGADKTAIPCHYALSGIYFEMGNWHRALWYLSTIYIRQEGKVPPDILLHLRFSILSFIHSLESSSPPGKEQIENVVATLGVLVNKIKDEKLHTEISSYLTLLKGKTLLHLKGKEQKRNKKPQEADPLLCQFLLELANECYGKGFYQLAIQVYKKGIELAIPKESKAVLYSQMGIAYMAIGEWETGFSLYNKHCKMSLSDPIISVSFMGGFGLFLQALAEGKIPPDIEKIVKPLIEEYISFLKPKDLIGIVPEVLSRIKKFISPKLFASKFRS